MDRMPALPEKRIVVEFGGGDADGLILDSVTVDDAQRLMIRAVWRLTAGGEIGRAFRGISLEGFRRLGRYADEDTAGRGDEHQYVVTSREETDERVRIAIRYAAVAATVLAARGGVESDGADGVVHVPPSGDPGAPAATPPLTYEVQIADETGLPFNEHCFLFSDNPIPAPLEGDIVTVPGVGELRVGWRHFVFTGGGSPSLRIVVKCSPVA